jgi:hypothetical protein
LFLQTSKKNAIVISPKTYTANKLIVYIF